VHNHGTFNGLCALVRCKQKRLQLFSNTVSDDGRVCQILWQWVPSRRACHRNSSSGKRTQPVKVHGGWQCRRFTLNN